MNDKELLELAAKAIGRCLHTNTEVKYWEDGNDACSDIYCIVCGKNTYGEHWNPLTDDGDALRLAVKLYIRIENWDNCVDALLPPTKTYFANEKYNNDPYAATRRAIVRAAAEIGKEKP